MIARADRDLTDWCDIPGGRFLMGATPGEGYPEDGEGPQREVTVAPFRLSRTPVTNAAFARFVAETGYRTQAEVEGWSFVFQGLLSPQAKRKARDVPADTPWWYPVDGACWQRPEGPDSDIAERSDHPVTHVSWRDATAFAQWAGAALPSEAQWERAARGHHRGKRFSWGDDLTLGGTHRANVWQGRFPGRDTAEDGYAGTSPVGAFAANDFGLQDMIGNVWEWCADFFAPDYHTATPGHDPLDRRDSGLRSLRGGSFLCHASYCARYRCAARSSNRPGATASNIGFRLAAVTPDPETG